MGATDIEWATDVWNFVRGCRRVSPGCGGAAGVGGCYAERQAIRHANPGGAYEGLVQMTKQGPRWTGRGRFVAEKLDEPLHLKRRKDGSRRRIFVNSMSDLFFEEFTNEQIAAGFGVMAACPEHDFLALTKRAERMREWFAWLSDQHGGHERQALYEYARRVLGSVMNERKEAEIDREWPLPNLWLGVSAEDQKRADERVPLLLQCPAAVHWVSAEPLLGPIDFRPWLGLECIHDGASVEPDTNAVICRECDNMAHLAWIVVGSESGHGARRMETAWAQSIVDQCQSGSARAFTKQIANAADRKGGDPSHWPNGRWPREFPA